MNFVEEGKVNFFASVRKYSPAVSWRSTTCAVDERAEGALISCPSVKYLPSACLLVLSYPNIFVCISPWKLFRLFWIGYLKNSPGSEIFWLLGLSGLSQDCLAGVVQRDAGVAFSCGVKSQRLFISLELLLLSSWRREPD